MVSKPPRLDRRVNHRVSVDLTIVIQRLFEILGAERCAAYGEPGSYGVPEWGSRSPAEFAISLLRAEIMTKFDDGSLSSAKVEKAVERFAHAETLCARTNTRFNKYFYGHRPQDEDVSRCITRAREKIWRLYEDLRWVECANGFSFTSGSSVTKSRRLGHPAYKYSSPLETMAHSMPVVSSLFEADPSWGAALLDGPSHNYVEGNRLVCVPKNYKTDRVIAAEPSAQMYVQKGIHSAMRKRLKRVGVDLDDQRTNRDLALLASFTGNLATIDMSMASDTVAANVVEWFFPDHMVEKLSAVRSWKGSFADGEVYLYRKFSSMGNATTFEIESTLFWALSLSAVEMSGANRDFVGIYGDDIVVPTAAAALLMKVLDECGFIPNEDKTFVDGWYRESCGIHAFAGHEVTPVYIRRPIKTLADLFLLVNNLERWVRRYDLLPGADFEKSRDLRFFLDCLRKKAGRRWTRPRLPDGYGDGAFIGPFDQCLPRRASTRKATRGWEGFSVDILTEVPVRRKKGDPARVTLRGYARANLCSLERSGRNLIHPMLGLDEFEGGGGIPEGSRYEVRPIIIQQWDT